MWYNSSWLYRVKITIDSSQVSSDLTDFPVYVDLSTLPAEFHANVKAGGVDIRVTKADGVTELARQVVNYDSGADTGELHFKASGTISSASDTDFYIYYGNSGASNYAVTDTYGRNAVWSSFLAVYHLQSGTSATDATGNGYTGTLFDTATLGAAGKIGLGGDFDSAGYTSRITSSAVPTLTSAWYIEGWIRNQTASSAQNPIALGFEYITTPANRIGVGFNNGKFKVSSNSETPGNGSSYTANVFYMMSIAWNTTQFKTYVDGTLDYTVTPSGSLWQTSNRLIIGCDVTSGATHDFQIDEVRVRQATYSVDEGTARYVNQNSPLTFYDVGDEENPDDDARDAEIIGQVASNDERDAEISGQSTANDSRDSEVHGQASDNDSRDAEVHGSATDNDSRGAEIHGQSTSNDSRDAEVHGQATDNDARSAEIHGQNSDNDSRASEITGSQGVNDSRGAEIDGVASENTSFIDAEIHGQDTANANRSAEITGQVASNDNRSAEINGQATVSDSRSAEIDGYAESSSSNDSRPAEISGTNAGNASRSAEINGGGKDPYCPTVSPYTPKTDPYTSYPKRVCT